MGSLLAHPYTSTGEKAADHPISLAFVRLPHAGFGTRRESSAEVGEVSAVILPEPWTWNNGISEREPYATSRRTTHRPCGGIRADGALLRPGIVAWDEQPLHPTLEVARSDCIRLTR